jgi:2-polyprenyl-6-methoxyphenol hydroxylase-like FAD-dependent oxidoreductase
MARSAAVVGGGIGGLVAAIGLHRTGWDVTVFERADEPADAGTGLGLWPDAVRTLDRIGVGDAVRGRGRRQGSGALLRADGSTIAVLDTERIAGRGGEPVYLLSRPALLAILAAALPAGAIRYGVEISSPPDGYDLVVGADGINSRLRTALFGDRYAPRYTGATSWRGVVAMDVESGTETWSDGARFGVTPLEPGVTNWYAAVLAPEGYRGGLAELREQFKDWHDPIPRLLDRVDEAAMLRYDLHYLDPPLPTFVHGNVALIGDAAHAMTPDLGQGGCQAMIDGVALAEALANTADVPAGLRAYDERRRKPAQRIAAMSRRVGRIAQARRFTALRDAMISALAPLARAPRLKSGL